MRTVAKINSTAIDEMDLTISITMRVMDWRSLMRAKDDTKWPLSELGVRISEVLGHISRSTEVDFKSPNHPKDGDA